MLLDTADRIQTSGMATRGLGITSTNPFLCTWAQGSWVTCPRSHNWFKAVSSTTRTSCLWALQRTVSFIKVKNMQRRRQQVRGTEERGEVCTFNLKNECQIFFLWVTPDDWNLTLKSRKWKPYYKNLFPSPVHQVLLNLLIFTPPFLPQILRSMRSHNREDNDHDAVTSKEQGPSALQRASHKWARLLPASLTWLGSEFPIPHIQH